MCGISGFILSNNSSHIDAPKVIQEMTHQLSHRGPDSEGQWIDDYFGLAFGHRRLAIQDLSQAGHQPMLSKNGRYRIVFNGEIYNFISIREELVQLGHNFISHSDTEVILASIVEWGLKKAISKFKGMFAFALWDKNKNKVSLVRDRIGEKPLYYGFDSKTVVFASELQSIKKYPNWNTEINTEVLSLYLRYCYIPTPHTIYKNIWKMPPGTIIEVSKTNNKITVSEPIEYWNLKTEWESSSNSKLDITKNEAIEHLDSLLKEVIQEQMITDVPLGAFLSGGIDSSCITAIMQSVSHRPIHTFSIGFNESSYNEAIYAKKIASHLGTHHTECYVSAKEAQSVIPNLATIYDEPFADSSQIPTYLVSKIARNNVTVSLSGDGGDEVFCGYNRYSWGKSIWNGTNWIPAPIRSSIASIINKTSPSTIDHAAQILNKVLPSRFKQQNIGNKLHKIAGVLAAKTPQEMYNGYVSTWKKPESVLAGGNQKYLTQTIPEYPNIQNISELMMYLDMRSYLPDDILVKVDKAAMANSLETRIPFLDNRIIEFALKLPLDFKLKDNTGKWLLRQVLYKYIPKEYFERPKMGFALPIDQWLRGELKEWANDLLCSETIKQQGYFNPNEVQRYLQEHTSRKRNWSHHLWSILMFQAWHQHWMS